MLPRLLRVTRAKPPHRTALALERAQFKKESRSETRSGAAIGRAQMRPQDEKSQAGRTSRLLGQSAAAKQVFGKGREDSKRPTGADKMVGRPQDEHDENKNGEMNKEVGFVAEGRRASAKDGPPPGLAGKKQRAKGAGKKSAMRSRGQKRASEWRNKSKAM